MNSVSLRYEKNSIFKSNNFIIAFYFYFPAMTHSWLFTCSFTWPGSETRMLSLQIFLFFKSFFFLNHVYIDISKHYDIILNINEITFASNLF